MGLEGSVILVTGASGFIGANLCRRLTNMDVEVHAFVRPGSDTWRLDGIDGNLRIHYVNITDNEAVRSAILSIKPSIIYHLATHGAYSFQQDGSKILLTNIFGLWNILNACNEVGYELFVNTGSSSEYGSKQFAMREIDVPEPNSYYAVAKVGQSMLCNYISRTEKSQLPIVTFRLFSIYGPYEEPTRLIPSLMYAAIEDRQISMANPETSRDFVYLDDIIDAYLMVDEFKRHPGEIFNLGTGVQVSLKDIVNTTSDVFGKTVNAKWSDMESRIWDTSVWVADISKVRRLTGWRPQVSLIEGLEKCKRWFKEYSDIYKERLSGLE